MMFERRTRLAVEGEESFWWLAKSYQWLSRKVAEELYDSDPKRHVQERIDSTHTFLIS